MTISRVTFWIDETGAIFDDGGGPNVADVLKAPEGVRDARAERAAYSGRVTVVVTSADEVMAATIERGRVFSDEAVGGGLATNAPLGVVEALSEADLGIILARTVAMAARQPTVADVRREASRRLRQVVAARDDRHLELIQLRAHEASINLLDKRASGQAWTAAETAEVERYCQVRQMFDAIRAASNALEPAPPKDYMDKRWWP